MKQQKNQRFSASSTRLVCLCLLLLGFSLSAGAAQTNDQNVFRLNVSPNGYPPYLIVNQEAPSGIMWDVVSLISERIGYQLVAKKIPRKRVDQMLLDGYIDGTPRAKQWTRNSEKFLFTDPIVDIQEVFFTPKDADSIIQAQEDLISKTLVTHLGYLYPPLQPYLDSGAITRFDVSNDRDMFYFLLRSDRFDAAVADLLVGRWILKNEGLQNRFHVSSESISSYGFRIMLRQESQPFADKFNKELARLRKNGELAVILATYR